mgnify:CR=1 FL=1
MNEILDTVALVLVLIGALLCLTAAIGLLRFHDVPTRLHAATKPQVLGLILICIAIALALRAWPVAAFLVPIVLILVRTFGPGLDAFLASVRTPAAISALNLSLLIVAIVVPLNVVFGVATALALARGRFPGKGLLQAVVDLPFAVSPM